VRRATHCATPPVSLVPGDRGNSAVPKSCFRNYLDIYLLLYSLYNNIIISNNNNNNNNYNNDIYNNSIGVVIAELFLT